MTEYANFLTGGMPAGYSSLGSYGFNPYYPRSAARRRRTAGSFAQRFQFGSWNRGGGEPGLRYALALKLPVPS